MDGRGRHDFANALVAERDDGLDELAVFLFENALFGTGSDEGFDILGRIDRRIVTPSAVVEIEERTEDPHQFGERTASIANDLDQRHQPGQPVPAASPIEEQRQQVDEDEHGQK